jgi:hypothetical protein
MMPPFPPPPLKSRTAGFPQYGFKAGISDSAFPSTTWYSRRVVCVCPSCTPLPIRRILALSRGTRCAGAPPFKRPSPLYPRGPRSGPGYSVPAHHHLFGPMRPTRQHTPISPTRFIRGALAVRPHCDAEATNEWFRAFVDCSLSTCRPLRPRKVHRLQPPSSFTDDTGLRTKEEGLGTFHTPRSDSIVGIFDFGASLRFSIVTTCRLACPPCRS